MRSCWYVHIYCRFASWVCNIPLSLVQSTSLTFPFCAPLSFSHFSKSPSFPSFFSAIRSQRSSRSSKLSRFSIFVDIFVRLNDCRIKIVKLSEPMGEKTTCPLFLFYSHRHPYLHTVFVLYKIAVEYNAVYYAFIQCFRLESAAKLRGNGFCTMLLTLN